MSTAYCGDSATITGAGNVSCHSWTLDLSSNEIDTRAFGDGEYGSWLSCSSQGTLTVSSYDRPDVDLGDSVTFTLGFAASNVSASTVITGQNINVDAKGVQEFTTTGRVTGALSF